MTILDFVRLFLVLMVGNLLNLGNKSRNIVEFISNIFLTSCLVAFGLEIFLLVIDFQEEVDYTYLIVFYCVGSSIRVIKNAK